MTGHTPPRRRHFVILALAWTVFISYGSFVPLNFGSANFTEALERFRSLPAPSVGLSIGADFATNILIFVPLTFLWMGVFVCDRGRWTRLIVAAGLLPLALVASLTLEFVQFWFPGRTPSRSDILAETTGGGIGILLWLLVGQQLADWLRTYSLDLRPRSRLTLLLQLYLLGFILFAVMPLDLTISLTELYDKYQDGRVVLIPFSYPYASAAGVVYQFFADIVLFVPVGALLALVEARWRM